MVKNTNIFTMCLSSRMRLGQENRYIHFVFDLTNGLRQKNNDIYNVFDFKSACVFKFDHNFVLLNGFELQDALCAENSSSNSVFCVLSSNCVFELMNAPCPRKPLYL